MAAGGLVKAIIPGQAIGNANTVLGSGTTIAQGLFLEMFFTAQLVFVVLMLAMEKSKDTPLAPIGIGLTLFVVMVAGKLVHF
jgi:aquaporin rerated protein, other eukaryote